MPIFPVTKLPTPPPPISIPTVLPYSAGRKELISKDVYLTPNFITILPFALLSRTHGLKDLEMTIAVVKIIAPTNGSIGKLNIAIDKNEVKNATSSEIDINLVVKTGVTTVKTTMVSFPFATGTTLTLATGTNTVNFLKDDELSFEVDVKTNALDDSGMGKIDMASLNYTYTVLA